MSLKNKVKNALKWKKTSEYCAEKLGITEEEFDKIKKEIYAEGREKRKEERDMSQMIVHHHLMLKKVKEKLLESHIQNLSLLKKLYNY